MIRSSMASCSVNTSLFGTIQWSSFFPIRFQELQKIQNKKKMTGSNEIESEENVQPSATTRRRPARRQRNRKRPQTTTRRVRRVKRVRRRPNRRPRERSRRRPIGKTTRRRKIATRMRRVNPWDRRGCWEGRCHERRSRSRSPNETSYNLKKIYDIIL